jgi:hypothetical protein
MNGKTKRSPKTENCVCLCHEVGALLNEALKRMGPPEAARRHFDAARVEFLKGLRAVLDERIAQASNPAAKARGEKIRVG